MKKIFFLLFCCSLLACSKDDPKTLNADEKTLNSIVGKWQHLNFWSGATDYKIDVDYSSSEYDPYKKCITEFKRDGKYFFTHVSGKVDTSSFIIKDGEQQALEFEDWDFAMWSYIAMPDHPENMGMYVKEIFIEEVTKDYLIVRCDIFTHDGAVGPVFTKFRRAQ